MNSVSSVEGEEGRCRMNGWEGKKGREEKEGDEKVKMVAFKERDMWRENLGER